MDPCRFDDLLRSFSRTPSRRAMTRALSRLTFGGVLGLLGLTETDAKRNKKKKRQRKKRRKQEQPFCTGMNLCTGDLPACGVTSVGYGCACLVTAEAGTPFCAEAWTLTLSCDACGPGEMCVALGGNCEDGMACATPCADPF